jgi:uncharacterized protein (TIGR02118 family)
MVKLIVLYPQPSDIEKFEKDYQAHLRLAHEKTGIPVDVKPYTVTKMLPISPGSPHFYQMFAMPFNSLEELQAAMSSPEMQEVAADAERISTGGPPIMMIGNDD